VTAVNGRSCRSSRARASACNGCAHSAGGFLLAKLVGGYSSALIQRVLKASIKMTRNLSLGRQPGHIKWLVSLCAITSLTRRRVLPTLWVGGQGLVLLRSLVGSGDIADAGVMDAGRYQADGRRFAAEGSRERADGPAR
jgi:hypothetical protein